jgi:hypothetical protein
VETNAPFTPNGTKVAAWRLDVMKGSAGSEWIIFVAKAKGSFY